MYIAYVSFSTRANFVNLFYFFKARLIFHIFFLIQLILVHFCFRSFLKIRNQYCINPLLSSFIKFFFLFFNSLFKILFLAKGSYQFNRRTKLVNGFDIQYRALFYLNYSFLLILIEQTVYYPLGCFPVFGKIVSLANIVDSLFFSR